MLKLILKWGSISGGVMTALLIASYLINPDFDTDHIETAEAFGYVAIFASLAVIYLALGEQAAHGPAPSLWQKIQLGVAVSAVAGVIFGLYNLVYTNWLNPGFMDAYYAHYLAQLPVQSGPEYEALVAQLEAEKAMFMNPLTQFLVMGATVLVAGIPVSILLALVHARLGAGKAGLKT